MKNFSLKMFAFVFLCMVIASAKIKVAITVDDLPAHGQLPTGMSRLQAAEKMLKTFKNHNIPEVYAFLNGGKIGNDPDHIAATKAWVDAGYPLGNHTFLHKSLNKVSVEEFKQEIDNNEKSLIEYGGKFNWKVFRYPFLHEGNNLIKRNEIRKHLLGKGYQIAQVTVDFEDWGWNNPYARCLDQKKNKEVNWLKSTFLSNAKDHLRRAEKLSMFLFKKPVNHILLLHVGGLDADILDDLLTMYEREGVEFISLSEAMKDPIYSIDPGLPAEWGSELTYQIVKAKGLNIKDAGLEPYKKYPKNKLDQICSAGAK